MNVGELKEKLDDYGDHLEVMIVVDQGDPARERCVSIESVDAAGNFGGEPRVELVAM